MSRVRLLVGTRKGAFILTSDGKRQRWDVSGPHFGGWEVLHLKGHPLILSGSTPRKPATGLVRWCTAPMTGADHERRWGMSLPTTGPPARINGTTGRSTRGNSSARGISSLR